MWKQVAFFLLILNVVSLVNSISYEEDTISGKERDALIQFKAKVIPKVPKSSYIQNYIRDWMRAKRLNIRQAEDFFLNHLKWREQEKIDTFQEDNLGEWAEIEKSYGIPTTMAPLTKLEDLVSLTVGEMWAGEWSMRQTALVGRPKQDPLLAARLCEMMSSRVRAEGKKVSQGQVLVDLDGFNLVQWACAAFPKSFDVVLRILKPIFSESTSKSLKSYPNRDQWMKILDEKIDRSQRSVRLGGTIVRDRD